MRENIPFPSFVKMLLSIIMEERSITKIYSQLESGVSGGYVTHASQVEGLKECIESASLTTQTINLLAGYSWVSFYVETDLESVKNALGTIGIQIYTYIDGVITRTTYDSATGAWSGELQSWDPSLGYVIQTSEACTIEITGKKINPEELKIVLNGDGQINMIAYPFDKEMGIKEAMENFNPQINDQLKGSWFFSDYYYGDWYGELQKLEPGQAFIYSNRSSETRTVTYRVSETDAKINVAVEECKTYVDEVAGTKQDILESGENIKTINGESLLGKGNITVRDFDFNVKSINRGGYSLEAPENTIPAYILSKKKGFTYVEGDVSFTSDNVAVLLRDATIDRTSNGSGSISSYTYRKVSQYDFGSWKSEEYTETRIPTFKEWILCCRNLGLHPYIRLNSENGYTLSQINQITNEVRECGMQGKVTYISFDNTHLGYIRNAEPYARLGVMTDSDDTLKISQAKYLKNEVNEVFINAQLSSLTPTFLSTLIEEGIPLEVWIVNTTDEIIGLPPYVSGITSDNLIAGKVLFEESSVYHYGLLIYIATQLLSLDKTSLDFSNKDTKTLTAAIYPEDATEPVLWSTSDDSVAIVDNNGNVVPIDDGKCIITATSDNISTQCEVNVSFIRFNITKNVQGGTFENNDNSVIIGETYIDSIVANPGFTLNNAIVSITMDGVDITSSSYDNGKITIEDINGEVEINVQCVELSQIGDSMTLDVSKLDEAILY